MHWISLFAIWSLLWTSVTFAQGTDWTEGALVPEAGLGNPYGLSEAELPAVREAGRLHTQIYPVTVTGLLPPMRPFRLFTTQMFDWIGLHPYPQAADQGVYSVPFPNGVRPEFPMGVGTIERNGAQGFTLSCAACHSANLFGKTVLGMTNRFPRANETFRLAKWAAHFYRGQAFRRLTGATVAEQELMEATLKNLQSVGARKPLVLGLDTSLAQVALSLNRRNLDAFATKNEFFEKHPRADLLDRQPADSKPAVWWNLKYKNRWLSDGSVISGNPVFTNILWNELGRGADLQEIDHWLESNAQVVKELTTAVFASEAPHVTDFFPAEKIDLPTAKEGQKIFLQSCARCHGVYEKAWDQGVELAPAEMLKTIRVRYHARTPVIDVGTDPLRYEGMKSLEKLNDLEISKRHGTVIRAQKGYVPPPLVGIWARWPYFHNNSVPSLCAVLTPSTKRPSVYYAGEANNPKKDFDFECNGYPTGAATPIAWKKSQYRYDTKKAGLRNQGHDEGIFLRDGKEILTSAQKKALIQFLQTL